MKKYIIYLLLLFSVSTSIAQKLKPTKEDIEKYTPYFEDLAEQGDFGQSGVISEHGLRVLDSLYSTDSNSIFLKKELININFKLIHNELRTDRVLQNILIFQSLMKAAPDETKLYYLDPLASLYRYSGDFQTAISYYTTILKLDLDSSYKNFILQNLTGTCLDAGENKKAPETIWLFYQTDDIEGENSMFAKVYYKNNLLDSALLYINKSLENGNNHYTAYTTKAKILKAQGKTDGICTLVQQAMDLIEEQKLEQMLEQRDKTNPFIQLLIRDIEETKQLKKEYCN